MAIAFGSLFLLYKIIQWRDPAGRAPIAKRSAILSAAAIRYDLGLEASAESEEEHAEEDHHEKEEDEEDHDE
jgi:hypothetical protein